MRYRFLRFPDGKPKAVTFSYDDGCRYDINLSETINKYGIKCTFNINSAWLGKDENDWHLTKEEIKKYLIDTGHEIAVHGEYHRANGNLRAIDGIQDVLNCRLGLEKEFGLIVRGMAYPDSGIRQMQNGATIESITQYLKELDIVYSRTLAGDNDGFDLPADWHQWMPSAHHDNPKIMDYIETFVKYNPNDLYAARRIPKLFYIWGHSYEFDQKNNWEHLEKICSELGGKDDTWYATNIEIYDYVNAYNSLIFSADSSIIYNPSLITVWFTVDNTLYKINSGETLKI